MTIIRTTAPIKLTVYSPTTREGRAVLSQRCAALHAGFLVQRINKLKCPAEQKLALLDAIAGTAKKRSRDSETESTPPLP